MTKTSRYFFNYLAAIFILIQILIPSKTSFSSNLNKSSSLTLIPPSPVSDKITLSIRGAVRNQTDKLKTYEISIFLDKEEKSNLLYSENLSVPKQSAKGIKVKWQTKDHIGKHQIILLAKSGENIARSIQPLEIRSSEVRSTGVVDGAWSGFYMWGNEGLLWNEELVKMNDIQWREYVRAMDEIGMNIIVTQESFRNQEYVGAHSINEDGYSGKAFYPSKLFEGRMEIESKDPLETILSEADERGMYVFMPVGLYAWFDFSVGSLEWHKKVATELWERYGHHPSFYGWYVSEEIHGSLAPTVNDEKIINLRHQEIVNFFKEFQAHVRKMAPDKPVMLASNSHHVKDGAEVYHELLKHIDILCPFGFHRMPEDDITGEEAALFLQDQCNKAGAHLWMDMEAFLFGEYGELYPRPIAGLLSDLERFPNFEKILCFQFAGLFNAPWMSRKPGGEPTVKLYRDYKEYYEKKIKEFEYDELVNRKDIEVYKNPAHPVEARVKDLIQRMTLEEKVDFVSGNGFTTKSNIRLGIPEIVMTDGPLGPNGKGRATNYSACINMASTWDVSLIKRIGVSMGEETRILGYNMLLGPNLNIARVPHGGRTFESFGEDPYLMSRMGEAYIIGVQSERVITCPKHFAVNNQEWNRGVVDVYVDERSLREIYFPAFKSAVQEAGAMSIMSAYNQFRGAYCCSNKYLITEVLKRDWGFDGFVVSDWGGVHNTVQTANSGLDLEMPNGQFLGDDLFRSLSNGKVELKVVDDKVKRILRIMFRTGLFDESVKDYGGLANTEERQALALETAQKSIVLLKNAYLPGQDKQLLPLNEQKIKSIAVIGPNANEARMFGGGSGYLNAHYGISPLEGLRNKLDKNVSIKFIKGGRLKRMSLPVIDSLLLIPPNAKPGENGLLVEYFNNREVEGEPVFSRIDKQIHFSWENESPVPGIVNDDLFSARWTGKLISPGNGIYELGLVTDNGCRLYLDGELVIDSWIVDKASSLRSIYVELKKDQQYDIQVEFFENIGTCEAHLGLDYYGQGDEIEQAIAAAESSDVAIVFVGLRETLEGESNDRDDLALPEDQIKLIHSVAKANPNTIVILNNGTPITMNEWIDEVPAIIEAFYPGQEGGNAIADILFGDVNPSGKLPLSFIKKWEDSPVYETYPGPRDSVEYIEGIFVGYRGLDKNNIEPLFPFGYGLSYTKFEFSDLKLSKTSMGKDDEITIQLTVKNIGEVKGDEIVQMYISDKEATVEREVKSLKGFKRVSLKPGESKKITLLINKASLSFYDVDSKSWIVEPGEFEVLIGNSSRNILLKDIFTLK
ncbi:MAG: DUF4434 domain-containing protein [Bacteroidota bacterium]